jgi:hypothetical protein
MKTAEEKAEEYADREIPIAYTIAYTDETQTTSLTELRQAARIDYLAGYNEAMRWRDPKVELPEEGVVVFVKLISSCGAGDEILYTSSAVVNDFYHSNDADPFGCEGYYPSGNGGRVRATVIGWKPIE